jgi:hypothetical protein
VSRGSLLNQADHLAGQLIVTLHALRHGEDAPPVRATWHDAIIAIRTIQRHVCWERRLDHDRRFRELPAADLEST